VESLIQISGNNVGTRGSVTGLVMAAYKLRQFQISGAPAWADTSWFDIEGKTTGPATTDQVRQLLQTLLGEKFHLKLKTSMKETAVYELVPVKNGPKLKESTGLHPALPPNPDTSMVRINVFNRDMANFIGLIAPDLDRPIIDKTGLAARYDFGLEYKRAAEGDKSLFNAMEQQLGLKLVPVTESLEMAVIEDVQRPGEN
jgi:uncharacterized protein (TIGR03435 family)